MSPRHVHDFTDDTAPASVGSRPEIGPAELTRLGLPVPPGFTITVRADPGADGELVPPTVAAEIAQHIAALETATGRRLGDPVGPLVLSVRSEIPAASRATTVLGIGLNDVTVRGLARRAGDSAVAQSSAWEAYRRLVTTFATAVYRVPGEALEGPADHGDPDPDGEASENDNRSAVAALQRALAERAGCNVPHDPHEQLDLAIRTAYTTAHSFATDADADAHTVITVQAMVFGNLSANSGVGVASTRNPVTGRRAAYGTYLANASLEDLAASGVPAASTQLDEALLEDLNHALSTVEDHVRDMCDVEFCIEDGTVWVLRARPGRRDAAGAFVIAASLAADGLIDMDEALRRVSGAQMEELMHPSAAPSPDATLVAIGVAASPGVACGQAVFDPSRAVAAANGGHSVILVCLETQPDDVPGILAAHGVLTTRGGRTSHAAVVTRGIGKPSVCGANTIELDIEARQLRVDGVTVHEGDSITIDGTTARVYLGHATVTPSAVARHLEGATTTETSPLMSAVDHLLRHADTRRQMRVRANVDTPAEAARARRLGAEGIGLCRIEHMLLGERRELVERIVLASTQTDRDTAVHELHTLLRTDLIAILKQMDGLPVTVRLIDPPLHEFLPASQVQEHNPMLGIRGVRLTTAIPSLLDAQVRAIAEAVAAVGADGGQPCAEILIPFVATVEELRSARTRITAVLRDMRASTGSAVHDTSIGSMIEVPRAALTSAQIAEASDFISFGTNDLTQMAWGLSRDDSEVVLVPLYLQHGILGVSPFQTLDSHGVGRLMRIAITDARQTRPHLPIGACGEHSSDPASIHVLHQLGLDHISCSPSSLPIARLEAGRAAVGAPPDSNDIATRSVG